MAFYIAQQGDIPGAQVRWEEALALQERIGDVRGKSSTLANMAWAAGEAGQAERERALHREAIKAFKAARAWPDLAMHLGHLGLAGGPDAAAFLAQALWLCAHVEVPLYQLMAFVQELFSSSSHPRAWLPPSLHLRSGSYASMASTSPCRRPGGRKRAPCWPTVSKPRAFRLARYGTTRIRIFLSNCFSRSFGASRPWSIRVAGLSTVLSSAFLYLVVDPPHEVGSRPPYLPGGPMHEDLPPLGSTVGPWLILDRVDSGSYGVVFRARRIHAPQSPPVAMKVAKLPGDPRFERGTEALHSSPPPSIPRFEGKGLWLAASGCGYPYLTMESVEGPTLYHWFREQPRSSLDVLRVVVQLAGALASAHARGIVHRDVKGDNIRATPEGRAVLLDWGSCWLPSARPLTDTQLPPGTSAYRPPEQRGFLYAFLKDMDARWQSRPSDNLYSLGVTLYRLVTGMYLPPCTDGMGLVEREVLNPSEWVTVSSSSRPLFFGCSRMSGRRGARRSSSCTRRWRCCRRRGPMHGSPSSSSAARHLPRAGSPLPMASTTKRSSRIPSPHPCAQSASASPPSLSWGLRSCWGFSSWRCCR